MKWPKKLSHHIRKFLSKAWHVQLFIVFLIVSGLIGLTFVSNYISNVLAFWDEDPDRGAIVVDGNRFGDKVSSIRYLDQGWKPKDSLWFDNTTQGSDLMPYDFFFALEQPNGELFRSDQNVNDHYRYLPRKPTHNNPDGLPIGFVKDNYQGKAFFGYTCAACHTGQVNYHGTGIRIDGAPAMADMDSFLSDAAAALAAAETKPDVRARFVKKVLARGNYSSDSEVLSDLHRYYLRLAAYRVINKSDTHYGFARLDAFGRIYNQVLEYILNIHDVDTAIAQLMSSGVITQGDLDKAHITPLLKELQNKPVLDGADRDRLIESFGALRPNQFLSLRDQLFNRPNAPVSYPFLWDIPQHDYLQWNGIAANAALGPIGRNVGEVIGVFGNMNWSRSSHWTLAGVFSGQGLFNTHPINYSSSVDVHNLALIEDHLKTLKSPVWPSDVFGKLDPAKIQRGQLVFARYCAACHAEIDRNDPARRVVAHMSAQKNVGTDPMMAVNSVSYKGFSGILRNEYIGIGPGDILIQKKSPVAALLTKSTTGVVATPDADKWWPRRFAEWLYDVVFSLRYNDIQQSLKAGDYDPDTSVNPLASVVSYKGRSLNGIWATAPYLHNGSVPTLYDLLLSATKSPGDPSEMEYRPTKFQVGSREFDPVKVGFKTDGYDGFSFLTDPLILGNNNTGHEYGTRDKIDKDGKVTLPALTEAQRFDLLEYLKSL